MSLWGFLVLEPPEHFLIRIFLKSQLIFLIARIVKQFHLKNCKNCLSTVKQLLFIFQNLNIFS